MNEPDSSDHLSDDFGAPIPASLRSAHTGDAFRTCIDCGADLLAVLEPYVIQKVWRDGETIFEFALCWSCMDGASDTWSEESKRRIEDHVSRLALHDVGLAGCCLCAKSMSDGAQEDCSTVALALGDRLMQPPRAVCNTCMESMDHLLSEPTRRALGDFTTRHFPGVPAHDLPAPMVII
jgi:uncharacterized protein with PIN domain